MDRFFRVECLAKTTNPNQLMYRAMHQDYSEDFVAYESVPSEQKCGEIILDKILKFGHFGVLEHPQISFNAGWFPHSTMQQLRTHRVGISFDVQSGRYTSQRIIDVVTGKRTFDEVFYLRPVGHYTSRQGNKYEYTPLMRDGDKEICLAAIRRYKDQLHRGLSEEHARGIIPFDIRQHFVVSCNVRSFLHLADLRAKKDAQLECQQFIELAWQQFKLWVPEIAEWYEKNRYGKARLSP